ncbi:MAG: hypothetical protein ACSW8C_03165 [bacterium]
MTIDNLKIALDAFRRPVSRQAIHEFNRPNPFPAQNNTGTKQYRHKTIPAQNNKQKHSSG